MEKLKLASFFSFLMLSLFKVKIRLTLVDVEGFHFLMCRNPHGILNSYLSIKVESRDGDKKKPGEGGGGGEMLK